MVVGVSDIFLKDDARNLFDQWLEQRGLHPHVERVDGAWQQCGLSSRWTFYKLP